MSDEGPGDAGRRGPAMDALICYSYTAARRHPLVIGKIGGFVLPSPLSPAQVVTLIASFSFLMATRRIWGVVFQGGTGILVLVVVPGALTWAVRHLRMEGRSPIRMLLGLMAYWSAPTHGWIRGRGHWLAPRPIRVTQRIVVVPATAPIRRQRPVGAPTTRITRWAALEVGGGG